MATKFTASQSVTIAVPKQSVPIQHYLRQPHRLVNAMVDNSRIQHISEEVFRLKMRPLNFMSLSIQPIVDMRVWADTHGTIYLRSEGCEIRGFEYVNQRFALNLKGYLSPHHDADHTRLEGKADLEVLVDIPYPFSLTPKAILETSGNGLLKSVLLTIKQRISHHLLTDYRSWVSSQMEINQPTNDKTDISIFKVDF